MIPTPGGTQTEALSFSRQPSLICPCRAEAVGCRAWTALALKPPGRFKQTLFQALVQGGAQLGLLRLLEQSTHNERAKCPC